MTGSEKILREEIFEPLTIHSLGVNKRWKISTAATQIQREDRTLSEWTSLTHASHWRPREVVKRDREMRTGVGSKLILFKLSFQRLELNYMGLTCKGVSTFKIISIYLEAHGKKAIYL